MDWHSRNIIERADQVLKWLRAYTGEHWWDGSTITDTDIAVYLLYKEGGAFADYERELMAKGIRFRLRNGVNGDSLSGFTAFFNPASSQDGRFGQEDWDSLTKLINPRTGVRDDITKPRNTMLSVLAIPGDQYIVRGTNNEVVQFWWGEEEAANPDKSFYHKVTLLHGYENNDPNRPVYRDFYFGTYTDCRLSGFTGCP